MSVNHVRRKTVFRIFRRSISQPTSPSEVTNSDVQNLNNVLRINRPIVPQTVQPGPTVQQFDAALEHPEIRKSARLKAKADKGLSTITSTSTRERELRGRCIKKKRPRR